MEQHLLEYIEPLMLLIRDYLEPESNKVIEYESPEELKKKIIIDLPEQPIGEGFLKLVENYIKFCTNTSHSGFYNQLWSGFNLPSFIGDILISATNTSMYTYEAAPVATLVEMEIIRKLLCLFNLSSNGGGTFVTGGSNGNLIAMLMARNRALSSNQKLGDLCVLYSEHAHYSLDTAAMILGIDHSNVIKIKTTQNHQIDLDNLSKQILEITKSGKIPIFICATAGTTIAGAFDNIYEVFQIIENYKYCWLHVDASHGGSTVFSKTHRHLVDGCQFADSVVWDAHKTLGISLICSVLLVKHTNSLNFYDKNSSAKNYLFHNHDKSYTYDLGTKSIQCGRRADCVKLWLTWNYYGLEGLGIIVDKLITLARYAENKILMSDFFTLVVERKFINLCFHYNLPADLTLHHNIFHKEIRRLLYQSGKAMVSTSNIRSIKCIRLVITNLKLNKSDIDQFFDNILEVAESLIVSFRARYKDG